MKICVAQYKSEKGAIHKNIEGHKRLIHVAASNKADLIVFPELSLTGYEPTLANDLAILPDDPRLSDFQELSNIHQITIGVGAPVRKENGICIGLLFFRPRQHRQLYTKQYLHPDEENWFVNGDNADIFTINETQVALAICYEISVPEHTQTVFERGAEVYLASVAKFHGGIENAIRQLSGIAHNHGVPVLMSNCIGTADGNECAGKSSVWNDKGLLIGQLDDVHEGVLIYDTSTRELCEQSF